MVTWSTPTLGKLQMPWVHIGHIKYGDFKDISNGDTTSKSMNRLHFVERGSSKAKKNRLLIFCTGWISLPHICYIYIYLFVFIHTYLILFVHTYQTKRETREGNTPIDPTKNTRVAVDIYFSLEQPIEIQIETN